MRARHPMFRIPEESEKGHEHRILPIAPEFAVLPQSIPIDERQGFVFNPQPQNREKSRLAAQTVVEIGRAATVVVDQKAPKPNSNAQPKTVHASTRVLTTIVFIINGHARGGRCWHLRHVRCYQSLRLVQLETEACPKMLWVVVCVGLTGRRGSQECTLQAQPIDSSSSGSLSLYNATAGPSFTTLANP